MKKIIMLGLIFLSIFFMIRNSEENIDEELIEAVASDDIKEVKRLIKKGANVNARHEIFEMSVLHFAMKSGSESEAIVHLLIENGADLNALDGSGRTVLYSALLVHQNGLAEVLIKSGADIDIAPKKGGPPLHFAVENGNINLVKLMIKNGANVNVRDKNGETALDLAAKKKRNDIVELLSSKMK